MFMNFSAFADARKICSLAVIIVSSLFSNAQTPQLINYQGLLRTESGVPFINRLLNVRFEIRSSNGTVLFSEQQTVTTNSLGLFSTQIGKVNSSGLSNVSWQAENCFLNVAVDANGGTDFTELGTQQL
jgi:hypothetical protein